MASNKNTQHPEQRKQTWTLAAIVVAVILIAAALLWHGGTLPFAKKTSGAANNTTVVDPLADPSAKILLQYIGKQASLPSAYAIQFKQPLDVVEQSIRLEQNGALRQAIVTAPLSTSRYVWEANQTIECEKSMGNDELCATLNSTSVLNQEAGQLQAMFPQDAAAGQQQVEINKRLIEYGAFHFTSAPQTGQYANRSCQDIMYTLDYSQISAQELQSIQQIEPGFAIPNPQVFLNFRLEQCMDDQFGIALHSRLSYDALTQNGTYAPVLGERIMTAFETAAPNITAPATQTPLNQVEAIANQDQNMGIRVAACGRLNSTNDSDTCLRQSAIEFQNTQFCSLASSDTAMGDCIIKMATQGTPRPELCSQAGPKESECYANIAYIKNDISYCGLVTDPSLKALCLKEVGKTAPSNGTYINTTIGNKTVIVHGASQN